MLFKLKHTLLIILSLLFLSQCMQMASPPGHKSALQQNAVSPLLASPYTLPTAAYLALAKKQVGEDRQALLILAAGRSIDDGQWPQALDILSQYDLVLTSLSLPALVQEKSILLAKIDLMRDQPQAVLLHLSHVREVSHLPIYYQAQFHECLANAYFQLGQLNLSLMQRIKLSAILPDTMAQTNNNRVLWLVLMKIPEPDLQTMALEAPLASDLKGWADLALIARAAHQSEAILVKIQQWQATYPHHPAQKLLPSNSEDMQANILAKPRHIALLLPLTGPLAAPGNAIRDGFMAAYEVADSAHEAEVKFYDTERSNPADLYQKAVAEHADFIIGPLTKADTAMVGRETHPVPTLLLNEWEASADKNLFALSLSPLQEARQVARRAQSKGKKRAMIIAPEGAWGRSIVGAFANQWQSTGGVILDSLFYDANTDLNHAIPQILGVSSSEDRAKHIKQLLGHAVETVSNRRQDVDMIFLLAYPSKARQIMPLLRYYYAGDLPVYATSSVYSGAPDTMLNRDLDGIILGDMPWLFQHPKAQSVWPENLNSYNRLYALGLDSYTLTQDINLLRLFPASSAEYQTGILYLGPKNQIMRLLTWGHFQQGILVPTP